MINLSQPVHKPASLGTYLCAHARKLSVSFTKSLNSSRYQDAGSPPVNKEAGPVASSTQHSNHTHAH